MIIYCNKNGIEESTTPIVTHCLVPILMFTFLTIITGSVLAKQLFVSPDGDDDNDGTMARPFWSVQRAQKEANPGDTVYLRGGTYLLRKLIFQK